MLFTPVTSRPSTSLPWHERNKRTQSCKTPRIPRSSCAQSTADTTLLCDMSTGTPRPYVPQPFHRVVFDALHSLSHPGIRATQHLVTDRYVWPHINANVRKWARSCLQCQRTKVQQHTVTSPGTFTPPDARFDHVHMDLEPPVYGPQPTTLLPTDL